jgi:Raf kinase inhibitor-like YbhB/YbcL family protein
MRLRTLALVCSLSALVLTAVTAPVHAAGFTLSSPEIKPGSKLPDKFVFNDFGCTGQNLSPALSWTGAPADTKSFVLTIYDPDAPTGGGWWHWVMFNIPASVTSLPEGAGVPGKEPAGAVQSTTDFGKPGFGGACPPKGDKPHRYIFTVYALNTAKLDLPATAMPDFVGFMTHAATIGKATFTTLYGR